MASFYVEKARKSESRRAICGGESKRIEEGRDRAREGGREGGREARDSRFSHDIPDTQGPVPIPCREFPLLQRCCPERGTSKALYVDWIDGRRGYQPQNGLSREWKKKVDRCS
jgi:hypothetical protein